MKILLTLLPFWDPQIPPLGIVSLKTFLQAQGYQVRTVDANVADIFKEISNRYYALLEEMIPPAKRGNFHNVGQDVLRNQLLAHIHYHNEKEYLQLVGELVYNTFYTRIQDEQARKLKTVLDEFYTVLENYIIDLLKQEKPTIFGVSAYRGNLAPSIFALRLTREKYPSIKTVMGGAVFAGELAYGSENLANFLEKTPYIDKMFAGEGELLFLKYLQDQLPGDKRVYNLDDINGQTLDLAQASSLPLDFSGHDLHFYPSQAVYASRSCPFQCSFCTETVYWGKYRKKEASQVVQEMKQLYQKHRKQLFLMCDSLLNPIIDDLAGIFSQADLSLYWDGYLRADPQVCDPEKAFLWRRGGLYRARLGIESGSPHVLELMGKKISVEQIKQAITALSEAGIKTTTYWVIGFPGETEDDFQQTLDIIAELRDVIYEAWCSPFNYYKSGQVDSGTWSENSRLLYPPQAKELLVVQTWTLDLEPHREEAYLRMNRFIQHCREIGVPNPFTSREFYQADQRWKKLHKNAVPALVEFEDTNHYLEENKTVKRVVTASKKLDNTVDFDF